ncbi:TlpA disulfide reductase family protein [Fulvivirga kasyanovii]|uniref:TlpA family protein disulfide reductase n=1 Tax=Fulvivirga kasyanovii TaxID=396812 RepID=A0ABW9RXE2_9BACT|nr:TlpA disulfide reductase family protein [Fulvivirga kasyanovii]MTI28551.1 TlpA family protein disulfide reductase [Fulvivirga kasyanovii]
MKKQLREWGIFLAIGLFLYFTGLYTDVAALAQRAILSTGLITADTELEDPEKADFNFTLQTLDGQMVKLEDFKGKVIFLNLWATWCPPCIAEMPGIQDLYDKIDNEDIVFVMLSMDNSAEKPKKFIDKKEYTFPVYLPASRVPDVFRSPSIPTTYVISKDGKIVSKKVGMANYDTKAFRNFLNKQASKVSK